MACTNKSETTDEVNNFTIHRGTNISHWLSQNNEDRGEARRQHIQEDDFARLDSLGFDFVRLPISIMAETVTAFLRKYPHVKMNVTQSTMAELIAQLENHEFDFVLAFRPTVANPKIESRVLFHHRLAAIVNERHALASRTTITLEELQRYDLALTRRGTQARSAFRHTIADHDYHYKIKVEMNTVYLLFRLVRESNYVTILSESTVVGENGLKAIPITDTDTPDKEMQGCIHLLKNSYVKNSTKEFVRMLSNSSSILRNTLEEL